MTLFEALRILAETHTRDDDQIGFVIDSGIPPSYATRHSVEDYYAAWRVVREQLRMQVEPQPGTHARTTIVTLHEDGVTDDTPWFQAKVSNRLISRSDGSPVDGMPGDYIAAVDRVQQN